MKWIGWLSRLFITVVLTAGISMFTTFYVVNAYIQELLKPYAASMPQNNFEFSDFVVKLWSQANILGQEGTEQPGKGRTPVPASTETETDWNGIGSGDKASNDPAPEDAVAVWSQSGSGLAKDKLVMTEEQFISVRDKLTEADKMAIFTMLVPKLPQEALQQISTKVEGGITSEELAEIEAIVEKHLKPEEFAKLMEIVNKY